MNSIQNTNSQPQLIEAARLVKSPLNVRKTLSKAGIEEMKASILAHGLMQNLVAYPAGDGTYHVVAGSRRLAAIRSLQEEGRLPDDFVVPCQVVTPEQAREMSLAENTVRLDMHPADQFEAFAELIDEGKSAAEVAERFGVEESLVLKRMKLARVAPSLLAAYREDGLTLECLMAFTVTDDHKRQVKVFKSLQGWQKDDPAHIRACLTEKMIEADSKLARFVGIDAYTAAGGTSRADLFGDELYLEKPALLHKLADAKFSGIRKELEAEGWGWVEVNPERDWEVINRCSRIKPQLVNAPSDLVARHEQVKAELDETQQAMDDTESDALLDAMGEAEARLEGIEDELAAYIGFDAVQMTLAGCFVSIGQDGTPFIDKGLVKPEHKKQLARLLNPDAGDAGPEQAKPKGAIPRTLRRDLEVYRQQAAQAELAKHPAIAFDLLVFKAASAMFSAVNSAHDGPDVRFSREFPKPSVETRAADALAATGENLPAAWLKPTSEAARFGAFRQLPDTQKLELLARCVAWTLQPKLAPATVSEITAYDAALALTGADVAAYWRPTKANYLGRITREQLLAIGRDTFGEWWPQSRWKDKKAELAEQLDRAFADPGKHGRTPEQIEKLRHWLPEGMAFAIPAETQPAKAKKARKAA